MIKYLQELYYYGTANENSLVKNYPALNSIKAILIVMIIITHSLPESMTLYFMYMFHMPVFLGISGFLLKESAFKNGISVYANRMSRRLIIPWIFAFIIYLPFQLSKLSSSHPFDILLYPFYHLWYIPAYILGALICYGTYRWKVPILPVLIITGGITLMWYVYFRDIHLSLHEQPLYWLGEKRLYCYLFFYILGYSLRNKLLQVRLTPVSTIFIIVSSFLLVLYCVFRHMPDYVTVLPYIFFNISLLLFLLLFIAHKTMMQHKLWLYINNNSLVIYFYHPLLLIIIYSTIGDPLKEHIGMLWGSVIGVITVGLCFPLTWLLNKWSFSKQYLLGNL